VPPRSENHRKDINMAAFYDTENKIMPKEPRLDPRSNVRTSKLAHRSDVDVRSKLTASTKTLR